MIDEESISPKFGIILGDSILNGYYESNVNLINDMKNHFDLDVIRIACKKGGSLKFLTQNVFPREIVCINNLLHGESFFVDVFVIAGAVDLSDAVSDDQDFDLDLLVHDSSSTA